MGSQEQNIKIASILDNNQEENLMQGFCRGDKKTRKYFYTLQLPAFDILEMICVISCVSHLMTYFGLLFVLEDFFFFHSRIHNLNSNNINIYFACLMNILGQMLTSQFSCMFELDLT